MLYRVTRNTIINKGKKKSEEEWPVSQYEEEESVLSDFSTVLLPMMNWHLRPKRNICVR